MFTNKPTYTKKIPNVQISKRLRIIVLGLVVFVTTGIAFQDEPTKQKAWQQADSYTEQPVQSDPAVLATADLLIDVRLHALQQKVEKSKSEEQTNQADTVEQTTANVWDNGQYESLEVMATGYSAGPESTGKDVGHPQYGITYSGVKVRRDTVSTIAADPRILPIGTLLYIPDYGYGVVADTGSAIKGNKIDLYFETKDQVYDQWGKKKVQVYVLEKGEGKVTEAMLNDLNESYATQQ